MARPNATADWGPLEEALNGTGVDAADFAVRAASAVREAAATYLIADPASAFTADEARILADGGLDLGVGRADEPDVVLRTATERAVHETIAATAAEVAAALRVSPARIRQRASERTLFAVRVDNEWRFPRWQFDDRGQPIPGMATVVSAFPRDIHPVAAWRFMSHHNADLELLGVPVSPLRWLAAGGDPEPVADIARDL